MDNKTKQKDDSDAQAENAASAATLTPEQIDELRDLATKGEEYRERLLREAADFENYKKRAARERQESVTYANESLLQKLIPSLDTFEMALAAASAEGVSSQSLQSLQTGVAMIYNQLKSTLAEAGLEEIDARGKVFDPNLHEAVSEKETDETREGEVVQQIRKGFKFRNRLIRPAGVIVARKPSA